MARLSCLLLASSFNTLLNVAHHCILLIENGYALEIRHTRSWASEYFPDQKLITSYKIVHPQDLATGKASPVTPNTAFK